MFQYILMDSIVIWEIQSLEGSFGHMMNTKLVFDSLTLQTHLNSYNPPKILAFWWQFCKILYLILM